MDRKAGQNWLSGYINWYDAESGKGSIVGDDGNWYRIQEFCSLYDFKNAKVTPKMLVQFTLANDSVHPVVKNIRSLEKNNRKQRDLPAPAQLRLKGL